MGFYLVNICRGTGQEAHKRVLLFMSPLSHLNVCDYALEVFVLILQLDCGFHPGLLGTDALPFIEADH